MRVLYLGPTWRGSNAQSWRMAFEALGHEVTVVNPDMLLARYEGNLALRVYRKAVGRILPAHRRALQGAVLEAAEGVRPDFVFAARAVWLEPDTLESLRDLGARRLVHWHPDDYRNPGNTSPAFQSCIPLWDVCVTPKSFNVAEFVHDGARCVEYVPYAFDPDVHRPVPSVQTPRVAACFVGSWEPERASFMEHLARAGWPLEIWGSYWHRLPRRSPLRPYCRFRDAVAEDMARVFNSAELSLGFLRKVNRDLHTARTFEIPACGGVMLGERTDEQRGFFAEDVEALYFDDPEELVAKVRQYSARPAERERIRSAALDRCLRSRYRYVDRLTDLLARPVFA